MYLGYHLTLMFDTAFTARSEIEQNVVETLPFLPTQHPFYDRATVTLELGTQYVIYVLGSCSRCHHHVLTAPSAHSRAMSSTLAPLLLRHQYVYVVCYCAQITFFIPRYNVHIVKKESAIFVESITHNMKI